MRSMPALLFDLDGTLLDSRRDLAEAGNVARGAIGLRPLPIATVMTYVGDGLARLLERLCECDDEAVVQRARAAFSARYEQCLLDHSVPYPGMVELLAAGAARGWPLAVVTNKPASWAGAIVDGLGLRERFVCVIGGDGPRKPAPEQVLEALRCCGCAAEDAWMIGDHHCDIRAGRAAGTRVAFCSWGMGHDDGLPCDVIAADVDELARGLGIRALA